MKLTLLPATFRQDLLILTMRLCAYNLNIEYWIREEYLGLFIVLFYGASKDYLVNNPKLSNKLNGVGGRHE